MSSADSWIAVQLQHLGEKVENEELAAQATEVMAQVAALLDRADQVRALRAVKGKAPSPAAVAVLDQIHAQLLRLRRTYDA